MALARISCVKVSFAPAATGSVALIRIGVALRRLAERSCGSADPCAPACRVRVGEARQARAVRHGQYRRPWPPVGSTGRGAPGAAKPRAGGALEEHAVCVCARQPAGRSGVRTTKKAELVGAQASTASAATGTVLHIIPLSLRPRSSSVVVRGFG